LSSHVLTPAVDHRQAYATFGARFRNGMIAGIVISGLIAGSVWFLSAVVPTQTGSPIATVRDLCQWIADTRIGRGILESTLAFPIIEGIHLLGIGLSVGVLCWFDLRLLGFAFSNDPVSKVWKHVMPVAFVGFSIVFATGGLLFWAEAVRAYNSVHFWIKIGLLVLAGINAGYFEFVTHPGIAAWDNDRVPPLHARMAGLASLVLWTAVITTGRTMAYSF
jgi:hypothetical protein